jgi:hypothetical protein
MIIFAQKHYSQKHAQLVSVLIHTAIYGRASIALVFRFLGFIYLWLLDLGLLIWSAKLIAQQYAQYKFETAAAYSAEVVQLNSVLYAILWTGGLYVSGAYRKRVRLLSIGKGVLLGTLAITVFYAFAGESYRFSRAIILLGGIAAFVLAYFLRLVVHYFTHKRFSITLDSTVKTIIVGNKEEAERVQYLLVHSKAKSEYLGYVSVKEEAVKNENYLGSEKQLAEIVELFKVEEIVFCSKDLSTQHIMQWMYAISKPDVHFKIVPEESVFIIGSNSKDEPGDFYTLEINLALNTPNQLRKKRLLDVLVALMCIPLLPILLIIVKQKANFGLNIFKVLLGEKTWVGYAPSQNGDTLPKLKPSVLTTTDPNGVENLSDVKIQKLNFMYAKEYAIEKDLGILLTSLDRLGR